MYRRRLTRRQRRRVRAPRKRYSLEYLLARQPKSLMEHPEYPALVEGLRSSDRLRELRLSRRGYSLLHRARIEPHNLPHFHRTYRLPEDPFFARFLRIKRNYLAERERIREERRRSIRETVRSLPAPTLSFLKYLGRYEQHHNGAGGYPLWQRYLYPSSKKAARAYTRYDAGQWLELFRAQLSRLGRRYRSVPDGDADKLLACFVLQLLPGGPPPVWPGAAEVTKHYRRLSLLHHPDRGGDAGSFVRLKWARDVLSSA